VPTYGVTVYETIALPPAEGAVQVTPAWLEAGDARTLVGAPGGEFEGVTAFDAADGEPVPLALLAVTVNVYVVPLVRPVIVALVADADTFVVGCAVVPMYGVIV
jgi:hypothetical protein